jgi:hypothetical protein
MTNGRTFEVSTIKAEASLYFLFILLGFIGFITFFSFGIFSIILLGSILAILFLLVRNKLKGSYFVNVSKDGVRFRLNIFSKPQFLSWDIVDQVNFHLYEVNFRLRETKQVVNIQTNYIASGEAEEFAAIVRNYFDEISKKARPFLIYEHH